MRKSWLFNKKVIVTGATSGIGLEICKILIDKYNCKILGISRNPQKAERVYEEFSKRTDSYQKYCFDVGEKSEWESFAKYLKTIDFAPDLVINNAGVLPTFRSANKIDILEFERVMQVDYFSCVYSFKNLFLCKDDGTYPSFVNVSSSAALASIAGTSAYTGAKSALKGFTECLSYELKNKSYVALVMPGFTKTDIFKNQNQSINEGIVGKISMPATKMARKIIKGISKRKTKMIIGFDAHLMSVLNRLMPKKSTSITSYVLKKSRLKLFEDVFCD